MDASFVTGNASSVDERLLDDTRRLALVVGLGLTALALLGLAWSRTPAGASAASIGALATGSTSLLALTALGLAAAHRRVNEHLRTHADAIDLALDSTDPGRNTGDAISGTAASVTERVEALEARLGKVEELQNDHLVELIGSTGPPATEESQDQTTFKRA